MTKDELLETLPICRNCIYFFADHRERGIGLCVRHAPPQLVLNTKKEKISASDFTYLHPPVLSDQYCGEGVRDPQRYGPCEKCKHYDKDKDGDANGMHIPSKFCKENCNPKSCQHFENVDEREDDEK